MYKMLSCTQMLYDGNCGSEISVPTLHSSGRKGQCSHRMCRELFPVEARTELIKESGGQFDSAVAEIIANMIENDPICKGGQKPVADSDSYS